MKNEILSVSQTSVAQALAQDYFCIYYVNVDDSRFIEYSASPEYRELGLPTAGDDIISFARNNFEAIIHPGDQKRFLERLTRDQVVDSLNRSGTFTMTFRMMFKSGPTYVHLKVTRMIEQESRHLVIGISSVDEQIRAREAYEQAHQDRTTYSRVAQALAGDYFSIYVVDPDTEQFTEYSSSGNYDELGIEKEGTDFFALSRKNMSRVIYSEDKDRFLSVFTKENLISILERDGSFTMKYRLMFGEDPVYVSMKATLLKDNDGRHLVIGTNNIDAQMKREAEYQKQMLDAKTSARNDFLANMSHDIRTPMNAIVGYTNIAKSRRDDPEVVADALDKIGSSSHFLLSLINDILDISKIESGKMQLNCAPCDLSELLRRIEDITALQAKNKSLQISYHREGIRHPLILGDELRIEQILINIISNAIKYTPEGRSVSLTAEESPSSEGMYIYRFIVRDTGIGISEEYLPHIFESFTREQSTTINRVQGTGLGLAITAKIVEMMGGTIAVKSKPGEGSEFTVTLEMETLESAERDGDAAEEAEDVPDGCRILLVEDNDINAEIAVMILEQYGFSVDHASNGLLGLEKVRDMGEGYYDAILMDIQMPEMNGYEATRAIRSLPGAYYAALPIAAMSANAYDEDVRKCREAGMDAHIAKPFNPGELLRLLKSIIKRS